MKLLNLGSLPGVKSLVWFHALALMGMEALVIVSPQEPFVSVGYFQDTAKVVDLGVCRELGLPVVRREVGGGTVLLDQNQIFYQVILRQDNPVLPKSTAAIYQTLSQAPLETYRRLGVAARFKPPNDLITSRGKKISGQGGATIGDCMVFVGNIILNFDVGTMVRLLPVPAEKLRLKVHKLMLESMSSLKLEIGKLPPRSTIEQTLIGEFSRILGPFEPLTITPEMMRETEKVEQELMAQEFLFAERYQRYSAIKFKSGTFLGQGQHRANGELISAVVEVKDKRIAAIEISIDGDNNHRKVLTVLARSLIGQEWDGKSLVPALEGAIRQTGLGLTGISSGDLVQAVLNAVPSYE